MIKFLTVSVLCFLTTNVYADAILFKPAETKSRNPYAGTEYDYYYKKYYWSDDENAYEANCPMSITVHTASRSTCNYVVAVPIETFLDGISSTVRLSDVPT